MAYTLGKDCHLYYMTGGLSGGGSWTELTNVKDVKVDESVEEADVSTRRSGNYKATAPTVSAGSVEFQMVYDVNDAGYTAFEQAFRNRTAIGMRVWKRTDGGGLVADFSITNFSENQGLNEAVTVDVTAKVTYSDTAPSVTA